MQRKKKPKKAEFNALLAVSKHAEETKGMTAEEAWERWTAKSRDRESEKK